MQLRISTSAEWLAAVRENIGPMLQDHAACEKKAVGTALSLVAHYPDRTDLVKDMIALAQEELEHYAQVFEKLERRGLTIGRDEKDPYVRGLLRATRNGTDEYLLDRLLVFGVIEARGCERFRILAEGLEDDDLSSFYGDLAKAEAKHAALFVRYAKRYFAADVVDTRLDELLEYEAQLIRTLPIRVALH